jgi:putative MFS transporter
MLPIGLDTIGVGPSMLIGAGFCVVGAAISQLWAPETAGQRLVDTSSAGGGGRLGTPAQAVG